MSPSESLLLFTCEHGGNRVPPEWSSLFRGSKRLLVSDQGWDPGALAVARHLARLLEAPLVASTTTRLLVDLNRSPHNPAVFSELTRALPRQLRDQLLARHHRPHWERVRACVASASKRVVQVGVHSFAPVWRGTWRPFEVGLLYDPRRARERTLARNWKRELEAELPDLCVRRNAPYRGGSDGLTTALRREFAPRRYLGLELELNQRVISSERQQRALTRVLAGTLQRALGNPGQTADTGSRRLGRGSPRAR